MPVFTMCGIAAIVLGCLGIYAASPHQRLWARPWPQRPSRAVGAALLLSALLLLAQDMQRLTTVFVFVTTLMLVFLVLPYIGAFLHGRRTR